MPLALLLVASGASAQAIQVRPISIGDREFRQLGQEFISRQDCLENNTILFELDNVPTSREFIDVWEGQRCNEPTARQEVEGTCEWIESVEIFASERQEVALPLEELTTEGCETNEVKTLWFLAVNDVDSTEEVDNRYASFELTFDFSPPNAPGNAEGGSGERQIPVSWDLPAGDDLASFVVYIDNAPDGMAGGDDDGGASGPEECASSLIEGGMPAEDVPDEVEVVRVTSDNATGTNLSTRNVTGDVAAIAVSAVDDAGNISPLSNVACVFVVPTEGFWERYQSNGGDVDGGCPCSALGPVHVRESWPVALALLALAWRRRRS